MTCSATSRNAYAERLAAAAPRAVAILRPIEGIERVSVFGSYARGQRDLLTDLDLGVDIDVLCYTPEGSRRSGTSPFSAGPSPKRSFSMRRSPLDEGRRWFERAREVPDASLCAVRIGRGGSAVDAAMLERLRMAAKSVFQPSPVLAAYAYGSRVSGRPRPASDLDVGYYLTGYREGQTLSVREELRLASALADAVGLEIDLRNLVEAPLELRGRALEDGVRIYSADDPARVALERYVLSRYHDYKDAFRRMHELRLRGLAARAF